jgi:hypothetical protein
MKRSMSWNICVRPIHNPLGGEKYSVWGQTVTGRLIQVIFAYRSDEEVDIAELSPLDRLRFQEGEEVIYVIHARDLAPQEKRQWRRRKQ